MLIPAAILGAALAGLGPDANAPTLVIPAVDTTGQPDTAVIVRDAPPSPGGHTEACADDCDGTAHRPRRARDYHCLTCGLG